jgi:two-component system chemotaxis sensor kinase CheA
VSLDSSPEIQGDLLDDFFTECDEHLTHIRQVLILLEPSIGKAQADLAGVQDLFRDFHSLKGISAIVGLRAAEEVAHGTEDYLRELTRGKLILSAEGLDLLMNAAQHLERIVSVSGLQNPVGRFSQNFRRAGRRF